MMPERRPDAPVLGVGGVVLCDGTVLLVRRAKPPRRGSWTFPGGRVELGERLEEALEREIREETGWSVDVVSLIDLFEYIEPDASGDIRFHYVVADYLCHYREGNLVAGSDVSEARLVPEENLEDYGLSPEALLMVQKAVGRNSP